MDISPQLAKLNQERFRAYDAQFTLANSRPAFLAFNGDVYEGLEAPKLTADDVQWSQRHVRMLSGLYGVLRPLDQMQPYRLEMGTTLKNKGGSNLYALWRSKIASSLNEEIALLNKPFGTSVVVNLASDEYFKAVDPKQLNARIIRPIFQERKSSKTDFKVVSFNAKRARGLMARYAIANRISPGAGKEQALKDFSVEGYRFDTSASTETEWMFRREI